MNAPHLAALRGIVDAMRRSDPDYVASHGIEPCSDEAWDDALASAEELLESMEAAEDECDRLVGRLLAYADALEAQRTHGPGTSAEDFMEPVELRRVAALLEEGE